MLVYQISNYSGTNLAKEQENNQFNFRNQISPQTATWEKCKQVGLQGELRFNENMLLNNIEFKIDFETINKRKRNSEDKSGNSFFPSLKVVCYLEKGSQKWLLMDRRLVVIYEAIF